MPSTNNQISPRVVKKPQPSIVPLERDNTSIKLPTLVKRTPSSSKLYYEKKIEEKKNEIFLVHKSIPSAYIQDSL
jgi:hypothetical protein